MMISYITKQTIYHSHEWEGLVETGWVTKIVNGNVATMMRKYD